MGRSRAPIAHPSRQRHVQVLSAALRKVQQPNHPGLTLDQRADRGSLVLTDDQIAFPVPGRPLVYREHRLGEPGPAPLDLLVRPPVIASGPQRRSVHRQHPHRAHERGSGLVNGLVDALLTQLHVRAVRDGYQQVHLLLTVVVAVLRLTLSRPHRTEISIIFDLLDSDDASIRPARTASCRAYLP